jgi:branched-chain amino acid transport system ATP-binding protein
MLNVINGVYRPQQGTITFRGRVRHDMNTHEAAAQGIARTFQNIALFKSMSVLDNVMTGRNLKMKATFIEQAIWIGRARREEYAQREKVEAVIDFLEISTFARRRWGVPRCRRARRARACARRRASPLLLDEPISRANVEARTCAASSSTSMNNTVRRSCGSSTTWASSWTFWTASSCSTTKKIGDGTPDEVRANRAVIDAYLGIAH